MKMRLKSGRDLDTLSHAGQTKGKEIFRNEKNDNVGFGIAAGV